MSGTASATTVIIADRDLRVLRVNDVFVETQAADRPLPEGLRGLSLLDNIDAIECDEAEYACRVILEGKQFAGGARSYRKVAAGSQAGGNTDVVLLGPYLGDSGSVDGIVYARFLSARPGAADRDDLAPEKYYEYLVERSSDLIFAANEQGRLIFTNQSVERFVGIPASEILGRHFSEIIHPDDVDYARGCFDAAGRIGNPLPEFQCRLSADDGRVRHVSISASLIETDSAYQVLGICRDITESVDLRHKLLARNSALSALNGIVVALSSSSTLNAGLQEALDRILDALGLEKGTVSLTEDDSKVRIRVHSGFPADVDMKGIICPVAQLCHEAGEILAFSDIAKDDRVDENMRLRMVEAGIPAAVEIPLGRGDSISAILSLVLPEPGVLSPEQMEFVNLMVGILGPAIGSAKLQGDLADRLNLLAMLDRLAKSINAGRDLDSVIGACLQEVAGVIGFERAILILTDTDGRADVFSYRVGEAETSRKSIRISSEQLQLLRELGDAQVVRDFDEWARRYEGIPRTGSAVVAPLRRDNSTFGVFKVVHSASGMYGDREMKLMQAVVEHLGIAALNAKLFEVERIKSLELEALAREAHHRIKNNLQMIAGLLSISCNDSTGGAVAAVARCQRQIRAVSTVHDLLTPKRSAGKLELRQCLGKVAEQALMGMGCQERIALNVVGDEYWATSDCATALGIIANELVCNAAEHAFCDADQGDVEISVRCADGRVAVCVSDNGIGLPDEFILRQNPDCGLGLVQSLASYGLGGTFEIDCVSGGTRAVVTFF